MFRVDRSSNRISRLTQKRFGEMNLRERDHLQEWLAHQPDAFGEELLIIQKEFDRFDETRERLDLLALDKEGNLVVIENKLDDSGRDVTWQALSNCPYVLAFSRHEARVEVGLSRTSMAQNKWLFDQLYAHKEEIEAAFGASLDWRRRDERIQCQIVHARPFDGFNLDEWPDMAAWLSEHARKLEAAFRDHLVRLGRSVRLQDEDGA